MRVRVRVLVRACLRVLAFAFAGAPSVAMLPLGRAKLYSSVRARYMCLRSGRGSDVNVYNVRRGLRGFLFFQAVHSAHRTGAEWKPTPRLLPGGGLSGRPPGTREGGPAAPAAG